MGQWIELKAADGQAVSAWQAEPAGAPRGAVVVLQEIFGVNAHIRAVTDGFAAEGWLALAPATFGRVRAGVDLGYTEADLQTGMGLKRAAEALPAPGVPGRSYARHIRPEMRSGITPRWRTFEPLCSGLLTSLRAGEGGPRHIRLPRALGASFD